ncbi:MAG: hypothetical protein R3A48_28705 [Polyangiales bacterium]
MADGQSAGLGGAEAWEEAPSAATVLAALDEFRKGLDTKLKFSEHRREAQRRRRSQERRSRADLLRAEEVTSTTETTERRWHRTASRRRPSVVQRLRGPYGSAAGGGKSEALLVDALYGIADPSYRAVLFRRTFPGAWRRA